MKKPLICDLDGSILRTDLLHEAILYLLFHRPHILIYSVFLLTLRGKLVFKQYLTKVWTPNPEQLPFRPEVVQYIKQYGGPRILATASPQIWADIVAKHLNCFDAAWGSTTVNLRSEAKLEKILNYTQDFTYLCDSNADIPIAQKASNVLLCNPTHALQRAVGADKVLQVFESLTSRQWIFAVIRACRPHHWVKNGLLFLTALTSFGMFEPALLFNTFLAFCSFCCIVSGVYIFNDLSDLQSDRGHPRKCMRPFAAGQVSILAGISLGTFLFICGFTISFGMPIVQGMALLYILLNLIYSSVVKRMAFLDVIFLAGFYMLRIVLGAFIIKTQLTFWYLSFLTCIFIQFAFLKRYIETTQLKQNIRRYYVNTDAPLLQLIGIGFAFVAYLILALYTQSPQINGVYRNVIYLNLLIPLLLYHNLTFWLKAHRGVLHDDPLVAVLKSRVSWVVGVLGAILVYLAR